ncbi:unnamed protein product [Trichogramma brassicae]|uniref:Uncharacterized protein n=1 Tax=Trichogramma brassicae TaxID=86971 RepID=A0A6H5HZC7_9HYME|nr:unnamed protein product [Trichogramma brassicae]
MILIAGCALEVFQNRAARWARVYNHTLSRHLVDVSPISLSASSGLMFTRLPILHLGSCHGVDNNNNNNNKQHDGKQYKTEAKFSPGFYWMTIVTTYTAMSFQIFQLGANASKLPFIPVMLTPVPLNYISYHTIRYHNLPYHNLPYYEFHRPSAEIGQNFKGQF